MHSWRRCGIGRIVCGLLCLSFALFSSPCFSREPQENPTDPVTKAGSELTAAYQQALARFAVPKQEVLRRAERAWIIFSDKHEALLGALRRENLLTPDAVYNAEMGEVSARTNHLRAFYVTGNPMPNTAKSVWEGQDQQLQKVYDECIRRLNGNDQRLLRDAERAWITYRDADAASAGFAYNNEGVLNTAAVRLTAIRCAQLNALLDSINGKSATPEAAPQNDSPDPADVKGAAQLRDEAKGVLKALLAKRDDPFFKKADAIKNVPDLPPEMAGHLSKLETKSAELSRKPYSAKLLEPALNEYAAVELLSAWSTFISQLKTGNAEDAGNPIRAVLSIKPKDVTPDYLPLWQTAASWHDAYVRDELKFRGHINKAQYLAGRGRTSEAIKEYEAAYDIIENSSIPEQIRKLREQSLGL